MSVLLKAQEKGMKPQALIDRPELPWYYEVFLNHFAALSSSRTYRPDVRVTPKGKIYSSTPNAIDINSIIQYNKHIVKMESHADFISIIQVLDSLYIQHFQKQRG